MAKPFKSIGWNKYDMEDDDHDAERRRRGGGRDEDQAVLWIFSVSFMKLRASAGRMLLGYFPSGNLQL